MAKRWPPILGVTGFDGGSKSAIALATRTGRLQGGEGEQVPSDRGPGACCHTDGTCDELSQFDCLASGGTWQGPGTTCDDVSCTGACCNGADCTPDLTQSECEDGGGIFQGVGTDCDPNPCPTTGTGACCVGDVCTTETEDDCLGMGGTYQGDDTTCDPNPCCSCNCGFEDFFGTPNIRYKTKTYVFSRVSSVVEPSEPTCTEDQEFVTVKTWTVTDCGTCQMNTTCSGSVDAVIDDIPCNEDWVNSGVHEHDDSFGFAGGCHENPPGCEGCAVGACDLCTLTPTSATTAECTCSFHDSTQDVEQSLSATLSDPFPCIGEFLAPP